MSNPCRITSYNVCYTKLLRNLPLAQHLNKVPPGTDKQYAVVVQKCASRHRITSYNVCYTKLLRNRFQAIATAALKTANRSVGSVEQKNSAGPNGSYSIPRPLINSHRSKIDLSPFPRLEVIFASLSCSVWKHTFERLPRTAYRSPAGPCRGAAQAADSLFHLAEQAGISYNFV